MINLIDPISEIVPEKYREQLLKAINDHIDTVTAPLLIRVRKLTEALDKIRRDPSLCGDDCGLIADKALSEISESTK